MGFKDLFDLHRILEWLKSADFWIHLTQPQLNLLRAGCPGPCPGGFWSRFQNLSGQPVSPLCHPTQQKNTAVFIIGKSIYQNKRIRLNVFSS